jgi:hypothetical protein
LLASSYAEVIGAPLNGSVAFIREGNVVLTGDSWTAMINFNLSSYQEELQADLGILREIAERTTSVGELRHLETALEKKLSSLRQFLPKANRKRGVLDAGGIVLRTLFGTATAMDEVNYMMR